jgi:predicted RNase H-like nuclease (RuvC/YqgF family)
MQKENERTRAALRSIVNGIKRREQYEARLRMTAPGTRRTKAMLERDLQACGEQMLKVTAQHKRQKQINRTLRAEITELKREIRELHTENIRNLYDEWRRNPYDE